MDKKIISIIAIVAVVAVVLVAVVAMRKDAPVGETQKPTTTSQPTNKNEGSTAATTRPTSDAEIDALEKDINSLGDEDFGDASLSDTAVGL